MTGKGRGRGKARETTQQQQQVTPRAPSHHAQMGGGAAAPPPQQAARAPVASAWGPPGGGAARATHRAPEAGPPQAGPPQAGLARAVEKMSIGGGPGGPPADRGEAPRNGGAGGGNGNGGVPSGRGAMRGRRQIDFPETLRTRPATLASKQGTLSDGKPINLRANFFKIATVPDWALHQYRVDIAPEEDRTFVRKKLLRVHREKLGGFLFDGTVLYTCNPLMGAQERQEGRTLTWTSTTDQVPDVIFTITIKSVGEVAKGDFAYIQVFNLLLRTCISGLDLQLVGRDYYDAGAKVMVPRFKLELWPGYKTSIRQHEMDILMCVEVTHKVMRMETVLDIFGEIYNRNPNDYRRDFVKEVVGCIVLTKYNNKTYRVDDVDFDTTPNHAFDFKGEKVTYADYMLKKYNITIRDKRQPMLVSKAKARDIRAGMAETVNLIPEVCFCTGLTDGMRANMQLMRELATHTRIAPHIRIGKLRAFNKRLQTNERAIEQLKTFDMKLETDIVKLPGRVLPEEKILYKGKDASAGQNADWTFSLKGSQLLFSVDLTNWVVVVPAKFERDAMGFVQALQRVGGGMRFNIANPEIFQLNRDSASEYAQGLSHILDKSQPQLIMCCVPNNRGDRYSAIKKKCCVDRAVATQVILTKNMSDPKKMMSVATKVAVQMNCKIGGAPWSVEIPLTGLMVVGFDVCHDTSSKAQSFGAMVASLDKAMSRYFSAVTPHTNGEELSNNLALNIVKAVKKYHQVNGSFPTRILIYRDGVGEGQVPQVVSYELDVVKSKLAQLLGPTQVKMTFVIVTKRINSRVFTDQEKNPPPGTVVDDIITDPNKYDFFLISQSVRDATVAPTSFNVIHDGIGLPAGRLQRLTYKMCHLYFNWSGTVRVPAPCQYAHKLAFLVGQAIHREPSAQLEDLLYFL